MCLKTSSAFLQRPQSGLHLPPFRIFTIDDLINIKPRHDLQEEYTYSKVSDKGDKIEAYNKLAPMLVRNIELLQQWYFEHSLPDTRICLPLNESIFNNWKVNRFHGTGNNDLTTPTTAPPPITMATTPIPVNEASTFLCIIKRSPSGYTKFKDSMLWKQWHRHRKATANSHGISQILDPAFVPQSDNARELFQVQQIFIKSVFEQCMKTNKSRHVVQTFESTADVQVYTPVYCRHMKKTYLIPSHQQILDMSSHYYALMINGRKTKKHSFYHGNPKS
jgi:hypothetical protein